MKKQFLLFSVLLVFLLSANSLFAVDKDNSQVIPTKAEQITQKQQLEVLKTMSDEATTNPTDTKVDKVVLYILAFFIPPVAVGLATDWAAGPVIISLLLTFLLFWLPGFIHALWVVSKS